MKLPANDSEGDGLNLTPVIDIVFLLLIFFLVATQFNEEEKEMSVRLPEVAQAQPRAATRDLIVNVTEEGKYIIVKETYTDAGLKQVIAAAAKNNPHQKVIIRADGRSQLKFAAQVMGYCNRSKMEYVLVAEQEKATGG